MSRVAKISSLFTAITYFIMIVFISLAFWFRGPEQIETVYVVNITADIFGMLMGYVLFICCLFDVQRTGVDYRYYFLLLNVVFNALFLDASAWLVEGVVKLRSLNFAVNMLYYMCMPIAVFYFWLYMSHSLKLQERVRRPMTRALLAGLVVSLLLCLGNIFGSYYFSVDEAGFYHREGLYPIHQLYGYAVILLTLLVILQTRKKQSRFQRICLVLYILSPLIVGVGNLFVYGLSVTYAVEMLILLLMYCSINVAQGWERAATERDMNMARAIQEHVLPRIFPPYPDREEFEIYASMNAARQVGGDYYDFFLIDKDHLGLVIADVSGKGVPAALFMMITKALIKNELLGGSSPAEALQHVNDQLLEGEDVAGMFVTVWLAVFEISTGKGVAANAGHENPCLNKQGEGFGLVEYRHSPAVGLMAGIPFKEHEFELQPGDTLFVCTDGVDEAMNADGAFFGTERMMNALNANRTAGPEEILKGVSSAIAEFQGAAEQFDDITMLCLHYKGVKR